MAKPNYSFEKRQRELAKKRKKEDKVARKANPQPASEGDSADAGAAGAGQGEAQNPTEQLPPGQPAA